MHVQVTRLVLTQQIYAHELGWLCPAIAGALSPGPAHSQLNNLAGWRIGAEEGKRLNKRKRGIRKEIKKREERKRQVSKGLEQETDEERGRETTEREKGKESPWRMTETHVGWALP